MTHESGVFQPQLQPPGASPPVGVPALSRLRNPCTYEFRLDFLTIGYREDASRIREKHLRENFAWLNRFTLSLLKQHPGRESVVMKRRSCGWSEDLLLEVLNGATL
jgi:hypothetical protein